MDTQAHNIRSKGALIAALLIGTVFAATAARGQDRSPDHGADASSRGAQIDAHDNPGVAQADPVDQQLAHYARQVPEVGFLRLYGKGGAKMVSVLPFFLGEGASNVDYEHDEPARQTLLDLQMKRIAFMLREGIPSTTLFKTGLASQFEHPYLCVITLDADQFRREAGSAARLLAPSLHEEGAAGHPAGQIDVGDFLRFTVDHEVFHCLNAYFNGHTFSKTHDMLQRAYQEHINEAQADVFASLAFEHNDAASVEFLRNVAAMRMLSVLDLDVAHATGDILLHSMAIPKFHNPESLPERIAASRKLVSDIVPSASQFALRLARVVQAAERLGQDPAPILDNLDGQPLPQPVESKVNALLASVATAKRRLTSTPVPGKTGVRSQLSLVSGE